MGGIQYYRNLPNSPTNRVLLGNIVSPNDLKIGENLNNPTNCTID